MVDFLVDVGMSELVPGVCGVFWEKRGVSEHALWKIYSVTKGD
jgi:hypothetical protein